MRRLIALTALLRPRSPCPPAAEAAVRHVVQGAGFGHGIGMSQYGAYGYAHEGSSYEGILAHYYRGTRLESAPSRPVRVLLQPSDPYSASAARRSAGGEALRTGTTYVVRALGLPASWCARQGGASARFAPAAERQRGRHDPVRLLGPALNGDQRRPLPRRHRAPPDVRRRHRHQRDRPRPLRPGRRRGRDAVSWQLEALKVQAVAARTYALATRKTGGHLRPLPRHALAGLPAAWSARRALERGGATQTEGEILTYGGAARRDLLLLDLGRPHREHRVLVPRRAPKPWLKGVQDPTTTLAVPPLAAPFSAAALDSALGAPGRFRS